MEYIQTKFCKGTFILETSIDLDNFLTKEEQEKFYNFKKNPYLHSVAHSTQQIQGFPGLDN